MRAFEHSKRPVRIFAWVAMLTGFTMALIFFRERMFYLDGPHFIVEMINNNGFYTPASRWTGYLTQLLPVAGVRAGIGLPGIMFLYSLNISLFYLIAFLALDLLYRDHKLALMLSVMQWLTVYETFYMPMSELPMGIALLILLIAHLNKRGSFNPPVYYFIAALLVFHIIFSHPLIVFPVLFCMSAAWMGDGKMFESVRSREFQAWALLCLALVACRIWLLGPDEVEKIGRIQHIRENYHNLFQDQPVNAFIKRHLFSTYLASVALLVGCLSALVWKRKFIQAIHLIGFSLLFTFIYMVSHPQYDVRPFVEIYFLSVVFFLSWYAASLISDHKASYLLPLLIVLFLIQSFRVIDYRSFFTDRNGLYFEYLEKMDTAGIEKAKIPFYSVPMKELGYPFAAGYESLLMSMTVDYDRSMTFTFVMADSIQQSDLEGTEGRLIVNEWFEREASLFDMELLQLNPQGNYSAFLPERR